MATIIERDVHRDSGDSSAATMLVGVVAIIAIVGLALFLFRAFPFAQDNAGDGAGINVDIEGTLPTDGQ